MLLCTQGGRTVDVRVYDLFRSAWQNRVLSGSPPRLSNSGSTSSNINRTSPCRNHAPNPDPNRNPVPNPDHMVIDF